LSVCDGTAGLISDKTSRSSEESAKEAFGFALCLDGVSDFAPRENRLRKRETAEGAGLADCEEEADIDDDNFGDASAGGCA
jgi:hypothetical protein